MSLDLQKLAEEDFCYLTTIGRISGRPHTIEIWFAPHEQTLYMLSGGRDKSDWVKNALQTPSVQMKINSSIFKEQPVLSPIPRKTPLLAKSSSKNTSPEVPTISLAGREHRYRLQSILQDEKLIL